MQYNRLNDTSTNVTNTTVLQDTHQPVPALYIGLMSGTSIDGIDAALVDFSTAQPTLLNTHQLPWPTHLQNQIRAIAQGQPLTAAEFAQLDVELGHCFAEAANQVSATRPKSDIQAIGTHGQTLAHAPNATPGYSLQLGNPDVIVEQTGITTVAHFRGRDIAAGGQGAPLVPAFHQALFHADHENRIILNIGGIANITWLPRNAQQPVSGYDTGPGNCLLDAWIQHQQQRPFDQDGLYAQQGCYQPALLQKLLADPYFSTIAPKSTGTDYFSLTWLQQHINHTNYHPADIQATLLALTAHSIIDAITQSHPQTDRILVCGGGWHNPILMAALTDLSPYPIESTASYGLAPDWVEAVAFAWLAQQRIRQQPGNLAAVTGAKGSRILGGIYVG